MRIQSSAVARTLTVIAAAGLVGLAAAGCTGSTPTAAPSTTTPLASPATSGTPSTKDSTSIETATVRALKFPNTSSTVMFTGYDTKNHLAKFEKVTQNPSSSHADLIPDPADPATHELPIAPGAKVIPLDPNGFPFETCPPVNCTSDDIMQSVIGHDTLWARIQVNAADQIEAVQQIAY